MFRSIAALVLVALTLSTVPAAAAESAGGELVAPSRAVAEAWAREAKEAKHRNPTAGSSAAVRSMYATYGVMQGLDIVSTIVARNRGAVEANPLMQGSYVKGIAVKAALSAVTVLAVRAIEKENKKAALVTMIALNVATAAVVAHNVRVARRSR